MNVPAYGFRCNCCDRSGVQINRPHVEVDLGLVCDCCKEFVRHAGARLKVAGLRLCSHAAERNEHRPLVGVKKGGA